MKRFFPLFCLFLIFSPSISKALPPSLPIGSIIRQSVLPSFPQGSGIKPAYQLRAGQPGTIIREEDLKFEQATEIGPGVQRILEEIGNDPYAAYLWIRNMVEFEPYHGVKRGAEGTAWERTGNSFDQAALLVALLRSQKVPARFVYGVINLSGQNLADWCGVASEEEAYRLMVQGGVPIRETRISGRIDHVEINHCWLEARVPYTNPGHRGPGEQIWIPMDPTYKKHKIQLGEDLFPRLGFLEEEFLMDYLEAPGGRSPEEAFRDLLREKLEDMGRGPTISGAAYEVKIIPEGDGSLPLSLPRDIEVKGVIWEESSIPMTYYYQICLTIFDKRNDDAGITQGDIWFKLPTAYLAHHFITISYHPATPEDKSQADSSPSGSALDPTIRDKIRLKPVILIDGRPLSEIFPGDFTEASPPVGLVDEIDTGADENTGEAENIQGTESPENAENTIGTGSIGNIGIHQTLRVQTLPPATDTSNLTKNLETELAVGNVYSLGSMVGVVKAEWMEHLTANLQKLQEKGSGAEVLAYTLSLTALQYLHKTSVASETIGRLLGVRVIYEPSLMLCGMRLDPLNSGSDSDRFFYDVKRYVMALVSRDGRTDRESAYMFLNGMQASYLEHKVLEDVLQIRAVSAIRILRRAREIGLQPLILSASELQSLTGLPLPSNLKLDIQGYLAQGLRVIIPPEPISVERWSGWGYIVWDPRSGAGGFMISGRLAGGNSTESIPHFFIKLWYNGLGSNDFIVVWSLWPDPDMKGWMHFEPTYLSVGEYSCPFITSVMIMQEDDPLFEDLQFSGSWHYESWKALPSQFIALDGMAFRAVALCVECDNPTCEKCDGPFCIECDSPFSLHPRLIVQPGGSVSNEGTEIVVDSITWSIEGGGLLEEAGANAGTTGTTAATNPVVYRVNPENTSEGVNLLTLEVDWTPRENPFRAYAFLDSNVGMNENLIQDLIVEPVKVQINNPVQISFTLEESALVLISVMDPNNEAVNDPNWVLYSDGNCRTTWDGSAHGGRYTVEVTAVRQDAAQRDTDIDYVWVTEGCDEPLVIKSISPSVTRYPVGASVSFTVDKGLESAHVQLWHQQYDGTHTNILIDEKIGVCTDPNTPNTLYWDGRLDQEPVFGYNTLLLTLSDDQCEYQQILHITTTEEAVSQPFFEFFTVEPEVMKINHTITITFDLDYAANIRLFFVDKGGNRRSIKEIPESEFARGIRSLQYNTIQYTIPAQATLGVGFIEAVAFDLMESDTNTLQHWEQINKEVIVLDESADLGQDPDQATLIPYGIGRDENKKVWWPLNIAITAFDENIQRDLDGAWVEIVCDKTGERISASWIKGPFPIADGLINGSGLESGSYTIKVTAIADGFKKVYKGQVTGMVARTEADHFLVGLLGTMGNQWIAAPGRDIDGLNEPAAAIFDSTDDCWIGVNLVIGEEGEGINLIGIGGQVQEGNPFYWRWDGSVLDPISKTMSWTPSGQGILQVIAANAQGEYSLLEMPALIDNTHKSIEAITNMEFDPWRIRIRPSDTTIEGVEYFDPITIELQVNVPGYLTLSVEDEHFDTVKTLTSEEAVSAGTLSYSWNCKGSRYIVPDGSYTLKADLVPIQNDKSLPLFKEGPLYVDLDTDKLRQTGKRRGKVFFGGIDVTSGNRFLEVDEISLPVNAHGFTWTRYYNSRNDDPGSLGVGWRHRYQVRLLPTHGGSIRLQWGDGHEETFARIDEDEYDPDPKSLNKLRQIFGGWIVSTPSGDLEFDEYGYLERGWGLEFQYKGCTDPNGLPLICLDKISGPDGLEVTILNSNGRIWKVRASTSSLPHDISVVYTYVEKKHDDFTEREDYYLDKANIYIDLQKHRSYTYEYKYEVATDEAYKLWDNEHSFHYALTRSEGPLEGVTTYTYTHFPDEEEYEGPNETTIIKRKPRIWKVYHEGNDEWSARGETNYSYNKPIVTIQSALGTEVLTYNPDPEELTVISRDDVREQDYITYMDWDDKHRLISVTDGAGVITHKSNYKKTDQSETDWLGEKWYEKEGSILGRVTYEYYQSDQGKEGAIKSVTEWITDTRQATTHYDYEYAILLTDFLTSEEESLIQMAPYRMLGTRITITDPEGFTTTRYLDAEGRMIKEVDPFGHIWLMNYDDRGNLIERIDPRGHIISYRHDAWDRVEEESINFSQETEIPGNRETLIWNMIFECDGLGNRIAARDTRGNATIYEYDGGNRLLREFREFTSIWKGMTKIYRKLIREYQRDQYTGWITTLYDLHRNVTTFTHFQNGWIATETSDPGDGTPVFVTRYQVYDDRGNNTRRLDPRGGEWQYFYDDAGRLERKIDPTGRITRYSFYEDGDQMGEYAVVDGQDVLMVEYETNEASWIVSETHPYDQNQSFRKEYRYDEWGNRIASIDPLGNLTTYVYRKENLLETEIDPFGQIRRSLTYDNLGRILTETDYYGRTSRYEYEEPPAEERDRHRVARFWDHHHIPSVYEYDDLSRVVRETRAGRIITYTYDENGNQIQTTETYDPNCPCIQMADGGSHSHYFLYDAADRLRFEFVDLANGSSYTPDITVGSIIDTIGLGTPLSRDLSGKLLRELTYDNLGRIVTERDADGYITTYDYYENGWVKRVDYPDGAWEEYAYNAIGVKNLVQRPNGAGTRILETVYEINDRNQVEEILHPDGRIEAFGYTTANDVLWHRDRNNIIDWYDYSNHLITHHWRQVTSDLDPNDCIVEIIPIDPNRRAEGVLLEVKTYNAAGDILTEANSSQAARGVVIEYFYSGIPNSYTDELPVLLTEKRDPIGRTWIYSYCEETDLVRSEMVILPEGSDYLGRENVVKWEDGDTNSPEDGQEMALIMAEYTYDGAGNISSVTDGDRRIQSFSYDELKWKVAEWLPDAGESKTNPTAAWIYDGRGNVTKETLYGINDSDNDKASTINDYDDRGKKIKTTHPDNTYEDWDYDPAGNLIRYRDPDGRISRFYYDDTDRPVKEVQVLATDSLYTALQDRLMDTPDGQGIIISEKHYNESGDIDWEKDGLSNIVSYQYDDYHRIIHKEIQYTFYTPDGDQPAVAAWDYEYDALGNAAITIDPNCPDASARNKTITEYDGEGRKLRFLKIVGYQNDYPINSTFYGHSGFLFYQAEYDHMGRKLCEKDGRGIKNRAEYDVLDRVIEEYRDGNTTALYGYEAGGNRLWWRDGEGNLRRYEYDNHGHLITETGYIDPNNQDSALIMQRANHDRQGNLLWEEDAGSPYSNRAEYIYDLRGRAKEQRVITNNNRSIVTTFTYDGAGNKTSETTPLLHKTQWEYDEFGRVWKVTAPDQGVTRYTYDPGGNLLKIEDAEYTTDTYGHFTTYTYDELGRRVTVTRVPGQDYPAIIETYGYDGTGNTLWQKDGEGRVVSYTYDIFDRVKTEDRALPPDTVSDLEYLASVTYTYDGNGNAETITEIFQTPGGSETSRLIERVWDSFDRLESEDSNGKLVSWTYDSDGRRISLTYPDMQKVRYQYDGLGRLKYAISHDPNNADQQTEFIHYNNGLIHFLRHPNSAEEEWEYKQGTKEITSLTIRDGQANQIRHATYEYDDEGNRTNETDIRLGESTISRTNYYDEAGRLREIHEGDLTTIYTYDKLGNREHELVTEAGTNITDLTADFDGAGMLRSISGTKNGEPYSASFDYDPAGNLIERIENDTTRDLKYDSAGRLVAVFDGETRLSGYIYNYQGRRIHINNKDDTTSEYVYDDRSLLEEYKAGTLERRYLYADRLLGLETSAGIYALHLDPLGSTLEVTNIDGTRSCSHAYDPWGGVDATCDDSPTKLLFTGHQYDENTGWYYFGARYYDPALARFLRPDPYFGELTTPPSLHKYLYAYANPFKWVDLEGYLSAYFMEFLGIDPDEFDPWSGKGLTEDHLILIVMHAQEVLNAPLAPSGDMRKCHVEYGLRRQAQIDAHLARYGLYRDQYNKTIFAVGDPIPRQEAGVESAMGPVDFFIFMGGPQLVKAGARFGTRSIVSTFRSARLAELGEMQLARMAPEEFFRLTAGKAALEIEKREAGILLETVVARSGAGEAAALLDDAGKIFVDKAVQKSLAKREIALGRDLHYKRLAEETGASHWRQWAERGITRRTTERFGRAFHHAAKRAEKIHFSLDDISDPKAWAELGKCGFGKGVPYSAAELNIIKNTPEFLNKTIFYRGGKVVHSPF